MVRTPRAASVPPDRPLSSSLLEKSSSLVKRVTRPPKRKASSRQRPLEKMARVSQFAQVPANVLDPFPRNKGQKKKKKKKKDPHGKPISRIALGENRSKLDEQLEEIEREIQELLDFWEHCFEDDKEDPSPEIPRLNPHGDPISRIALGENGSELDEQLKEIEREIQELLEFWEHCFEDGKEDTSPESPWISKWHLGHPLDMKDELLREDPSYNEEQVEQEALQDYLKELEERRVHAACKRAARQKQGRPTSSGTGEEPPSSRGRPTPSAGALGSLSRGRLPALEKSCVRTEVAREEGQEESGSPSGSSEEEEDAILPKRNHLPCWAVGSREAAAKRQVCRQNHQNHQEPATDQSCGKAQTSSRPAKRYNLRRQGKAVSYISRQEEDEEQSLSEGSCGEDWSPEEEGSDVDEDGEEEEEPEEDTETESAEELEVEAGPTRAVLQRKGLKKPVRSYRCPKCSREFSNSSNMRKHLLIHEGTRPYGCHACGKCYADPSNFAKHQRMHTGERRHQCPTCPAAFYEKAGLDVHIRRHQGIRPFACLECKSSFSRRLDLLSHMKVHVQAAGSCRPKTPVHCEECNKTYANQRSLHAHQKRHRKCEDCGEVFTFKFKYKFHRRLHLSGICPPGGFRSTGGRLCQGPAWDVEHPKRAALESSAGVPEGVAADEPLETAAPPRGQMGQPVSSTQAVSGSSGAHRPSVLASSPFLCQASPSNPARVMQELSCLAPAGVTPSRQNRPSAPVSLPVLDHSEPKPSHLAQMPLQLKPAGVLLPHAPAAWPVESSPGVAKPSVQTPSLPGPSDPGMLQPRSQVPGTFLVPAAAPRTVVQLTDPCPKPLTVTIPPRLAQPAGSNLVSGAASDGLFLLYLATLLPDAKLTLEIPVQNLLTSVTVQICTACQAKYVGEHTCRKLPQNPAETVEEEPRADTGVRPQPSPVGSSGPHVRDEQETLAESCGFHQSNSQVPYAESGGKEPESGMKGDGEEETSETEEVTSPEADDHPSVPLEDRQEPRQTKWRKGRYMCTVCGKRFVYRRSFRTHMRLHHAFS